MKTCTLTYSLLLATVPWAALAQTTFTKITTGSIVTDVGTGQACAWGDYDNDGFIDLYVTNSENGSPQKCNLYHNNGNGTFSKVTNSVASSEARDWRGCAWGDYDNDGNLDLFVASTDGHGFLPLNMLFRNTGDGKFTRMTTADVGELFPLNAGGSEGPLWADYDNDGFLDLFIARYQLDWLFHNNRDGTFSRATNSLPTKNADSYGGMWGDYDNDGYMDLFVGNNLNHLPTTNSLFHNDHAGSFTRVTAGAIATDTAFVLGSVWGDYDNDGDLDLFVVNNGTTNSLYRNNGDGTFTKMSGGEVGSIATDVASCLGAAWADYDNDGFLDLFVTTDGGINFLYHNNGNGAFSRILNGSLVNSSGISVSCAWGDYNNDGFLDLFVARFTTDGTPSTNLLFRNNTNNNAWLKLKLVGTVSNRSAIGAKVRVNATISGRSIWQMREISPGSMFSTSPLDPHFGLGGATNIDSVRIEWPSGIVQTITNVPTKQSLTIVEHQENAAGTINFTGIERLTNGTTRLLANGNPNLLVLFEGSTNLATWTRLGTRTNLSGTVEFLDLFSANQRQRFYRAVAP